jgi:AcrR family transcriptional regulator
VTRLTDLTDAAISVLAEQGMRGLTHRAVDARAALPLGTTSAYFRTRKALIGALVRRLADLDNADLDNAGPGRADLENAGRDSTGHDSASPGDGGPDSASPDAADPNGTGPDSTDRGTAGLRGAGLRGASLRGASLRGASPGSASPGSASPGSASPGSASPDNADADRARMPPPVGDFAEMVAQVLDGWLTVGRERTLARYCCLLEATHHPELRTILEHGRSYREQARTLMEAAGVAEPARAGDHFVACVDGLLFDRLAGAGALTAPRPGTPENRADLAGAVRHLLAGFTSATATRSISRNASRRPDSSG